MIIMQTKFDLMHDEDGIPNYSTFKVLFALLFGNTETLLNLQHK